MTLPIDAVERERTFRPDDVADGLARRLEVWARTAPEREACVALDEQGRPAGSMTYAAFERRVRSVAAVLEAHATRGDRVLLVFEAGLDFGVAFFACLSSGMVAVPVPVPRTARGGAADLARLAAVANDAEPRFFLGASGSLAALRSRFRYDGPPLHWLAVDTVDDHPDDRPAGRWPAAEETAILQYTSGSTAAPRGVEITHGNLLVMGRVIAERFAHQEGMTLVSWLPHFHDMGLISGIAHTVFLGGRLVLLSPQTFVKSPWVWLKAISDYRAATAGGPNFTYEHCVRRIDDPAALALDLSSWRVAFNGAEPVREATLQRFAKHFAASRFRPEAFRPCYGMAEATLMSTAAGADELPRISDGPPRLVSCGRSVDGQRLLIVSPDSGAVLPDGETGEIWLSGPHIGRGYFRNAAATRETFGAFTAEGEGPFLRTGDLGFVRDGELFVGGRIKELIIIDGRNLYPHDVEATAEGVDEAIERCCAFSVDTADGERLVIVVEMRRGDGERPETADLERAIRAELAAVHEVAPHAVVFVPRGTIGRTTSGKLQRVACRTAWLEGRLGATA